MTRKPSRRHVQRLAVAMNVFVVGCVLGLVAMTHHVLSKPPSVSRVLTEASSSCGKFESWDTSGGIVLDILALGFIFVSLAIICDDYFVTALERISYKLALRPDVAGATFMAAGSSAPELFVSLADNVFQKPGESMGVGTVVGSNIFNILIIISLSGLLAGQVLKLDWRPLLRDSLWYLWAISVLVFVVWDGSVDVPESMLMVCSYASYIGYMTCSERVVNFCCKRREVEDEQEKEREKLTFASVPTSDAISIAEVVVAIGDVQMSTDEDKPLDSKTIAQDQLNDVSVAGLGQEYVLVPPPGILAKMWFVFTWPIVALAGMTIPDCRYAAFSGPFGLSATFVASIIWMGVLSHYTVAFGTKFGCTAGFPSALMGLTIIAAGTSIPDALSSVVVARAGHGDMAVSNALGSNVFDILFGLGLPIFVSNLVYGEPVPVSGDDLDIAIAILFAVLLFVVVVLVCSRWRLYPLTCVFLLLLYAIYVTISYLRGLAMIY